MNRASPFHLLTLAKFGQRSLGSKQPSRKKEKEARHVWLSEARQRETIEFTEKQDIPDERGEVDGYEAEVLGVLPMRVRAYCNRYEGIGLEVTPVRYLVDPDEDSIHTVSHYYVKGVQRR
jgi:hypothetical protein